QTDYPGTPPLWGYYNLVDVNPAKGESTRVLLFKADAHLAHSPWMQGLIQMSGRVLDDSHCDWIYSVGTAGGSRVASRLGDVAVTNAGHVLLDEAENRNGPIESGATVTGTSFPPTDLIDASRSLLYRMDGVVTESLLETLFKQVQAAAPTAAHLHLAD